MPTEKEIKNLSETVPNNMPYIMAIVALLISCVIGVAVILALRPDSDPLIVTGLVVGIFSPSVVSLMSFMKAQETHLLVNSRMSQAVADAAKAAYGEGLKKGQEIANERTDKLEKGNKEK